MVGKAIIDIFTADAALSARFSNRIYPIVATQGAAVPYVVYEVDTVDPTRTKDSDSHVDELRVRFNIVAEDYADAVGGEADIRQAFVRVRDEYSGVNVNSCTFEGGRDLFSDTDRRYARQTDLKFRINK